MSGPVIGINLGNSYASIAVVNKEGHAECIANEDGERQIALAVSYNGEEVYIGNGAKPQLVKNAKNTIIGFRNLLGHKFADLPVPPPANPDATAGPDSAPPVDVSGEVGYTVSVLVPPPASKPTKGGAVSGSARGTPASTRPPSPPPPVTQDKTLTASEVTTTFLRTLKASAEDFLGKPIQGAVIGVSDTWTDAQRARLAEAAEAAGIHVLQFAPEGALAVIGAHDASAGKSLLGLESTTALPGHDASHHAKELKEADAANDRTTLVLDHGSRSLTLDILSIREGSLLHSRLPNGARHLSDGTVGGTAIDNLLIAHFIKEFTKKTKTNVAFPNPVHSTDQRAVVKLRLAVDDTKKSLQASTGAAACSVESLKDGLDFSGTINRLRFDVLVTPVYTAILKEITAALESAGISKEEVDEVLLVGGSAGLSGLSERLEGYFGESSHVAIRSDLDGSQLIAKGAALQAKLLSELPAADLPAFPTHTSTTSPENSAISSSVINTLATSKPIGLFFPGAKEDSGRIHVTLIPAETPLPARRTLRLPVAQGAEKVAVEVWEGAVALVDLPVAPREKFSDDEDEDDEPEEPEEPEKEAVVNKVTKLGGLAVGLEATKGKATLLEVRADVAVDGKVTVYARQADAGKEWVSFETAAAK